ncbi:beta strand repeat-containing protein [Pseudobdellovibrio sp. HCB154]|uniref:beta strand repeat-containing protein n=1 Tax=Pseudobdellovibrio sp. HCB154 TaxID=3386277 RepID=UPI0039172FDB
MFIFINAQLAFATPGVTTYQAKIVKPDGLPLESTSVNFKFTILDPAGTCILYSETYSSVNMASTGGLISFSLGSGVKTYPASATTFEEVFSNITPTLSCDTGGPGTYSPSANDTRKIVMQFHDGTGWQTLPAMSINAVPYAMYATEAQKLSGLPTCNPGEALSYNGVSFSCEAISGGGVTSSTVIAALGYEPVQPASLTNLTSVGSNNTLPSISSNSYALGANNTQSTGGGGSNNSILLGFNNNIDNGGGGSNSGFVIGYNNKVFSNGSGGNEAFIFGSNNNVNYSGFVIGRGVSAPANNGIVIGDGYQTLNVMNNNRVGIGTSSPVTTLDVMGGIRIGAEAATCDSTLAGTLRYNGSNVEYCNGTSWSGFSGSVTSSTVISALGYTPANSATVSALNTSLSAVSSSVTTANSTIAAVSSSVNILSGNLSSVSSTVNSLSNNLSTVSSSVSTLSSNVFSVSATVTSLSNTVSTLSTTVSNMGTSVTALSTSVANLSASMAAITASQWVSSGTAISYSTGNVGIGTNNPSYKLAVSGSAYLKGPVVVGNSPLVGNWMDYGPMVGAGSYSSPFSVQETITDFSAMDTFGSFNSTILNAPSDVTGLVAGRFDIVQNSVSSTANQSMIIGNYLVVDNESRGDTTSLMGQYPIVLNNSPGNTTNVLSVNALAYNTSGTATNLAAGWFAAVSLGGSVANKYGIFVDTATGAGVTNNYGLYVSDQSITAASQTYNIYSAGANSKNHFAGYVGIGVTLPTARLHLAAGTSSLAAFKLTSSTLLTTPASGAIEYDGFNLYYTDGTNTRKTLATGVGVTSSSVIAALGYTPVSAASASAWVASGTSLGYSTGKVGIGTTNPQYNLDVNGTFRVTTSATVYSAATWGGSTVNSYYSGSDQNGEMWSIGIRPPSYPDGSLAIATHYGSMPITFKINNVEKMRLDTTGNLGIGTPTPTAALDVISSVVNSLPATSGTSQTGLLARFGKSTLALDVGTNGSSGAWLQSVNRTDLSTNYPLIFNPNGGPVGVGGYASSVLFSVHQSTGSATDMIRLRDTTDAIDLAFRYNGTNGYEIRSEASGTGDIFFALDGSTGYVGIGTSAPINTLDVSGSGITVTRNETFGTLATFRKAYTATNNESPYLELRHQTVSGGAFDRYGYIQAGQGHDGMLLQGQNAGGYSSLLLNRMGGNVGIGVASPTAKLHVSGTTILGSRLWGSYTYGSDYFWLGLNGAGSDSEKIAIGIEGNNAVSGSVKNLHFRTMDTERMLISSTGNIGINTTSATHSLTVSNTAAFNPSANVSSAIMVGPPTGHAFGGGVLMKDYTTYAGMWTNGSGGLLIFGAGGTTSGFSSVNTLVVTSAATVGIGTTAPTEKLEVAGNLKVTGEIYGQKSWGFKKGPTAFAADYVNAWSSGGGAGSSIDCTSSANGCTILKSGTYEVRCVHRGNSTTSTFIGIALNGDRPALESRADAVWDHDHALGVGQFSESNFMGTLTAGNFITCGPATANQTYMIYGASSYNGTLTIKRID